MRLATLAILAILLSSALAHAAPGSMTTVSSFGSNPGALAMYEYIPANLGTNRPLVVVMHGCTQSAAAMVTAGWNKLADQYKFAVVYPQQQSANNPVECFNWAGEYGDTANLVRGQGENQSVIQMVDTAIAANALDRTQVYIVGFSAGAAFTSVMLATWPDRFAAGSIMEGVSYRCATSVSGAYSCQSPGVTKTAAAWGDLVRAASTTTTFPRVQIWEGTKDTTVVPANQPELVKQWTNVHGIAETPTSSDTIGTTKHEQYKAGATTVVETFLVTDMTHAIAYDASDPACPTGAAQYFEDHKICGTLRAAQFFGLAPTITGGGGIDAPPAVAFLTPSSGDTVSGAITIVVAASDDSAVTGVDVTVDGVALASDAVAPYQFAWDASAPGAHQLVATAHDDTGHTATAMATVTVPTPGGGGSGSGSGSAGGIDTGSGATGPGALPGCSLDAGGGGAGLAPLAGILAVAFRSGRRRRANLARR